MTDKIQEITEKIYNEGVIKAKEDANKILANTKIQADEIIKSARNKSTQIIDNATKQATDIKQKAETEMQLAARKFISNLKQEITQIITTSLLNENVKETFNDSQFITNILQTIIQNWNPNQLEITDLQVILPQNKQQELSTFFDSKLSEILNNGVEVKFDKKIENGFKIGPYDGSYVLSFTDKDFVNYFKRYFNDRTKRLLFDSAVPE